MDDEAVSSYTMSLALDSTNEEKTGVPDSVNYGGDEEIPPYLPDEIETLSYSQ